MSEAKAVGVLGYPDTDILERRLRQTHALPWPIPATVIMDMTEEDLDALDMARDKEAYWRVLNAIVARIRDGGERAA
jgi:hypothetical protein